MSHHRLSSRPARRRTVAALAVGWIFACSQATADIDINIQGVDDELRKNVLAYLSLARYAKHDLPEDQVERLQDRIEREASAALRPFGYYEPKIESRVDRAGQNDWRVTIRITPGEPIRMENVDVQVLGPGAENPLFQRILNDLPLKAGDRLNHGAYDRIKDDLQRTAATYGFLDARLTRNELRVDPQRRVASAYLVLETGHRYRFGTTRIEQDVIDDELVRRFMRYRQDEPFDVTELLRTQFALDDSQYFGTVEVLPGEPDREEHVVPVSIRAVPNRRDRYSFGAGYGTDTGVRGTATWENRRVNRRGHRFNTLIKAAAEDQSLEARYIVPIGDPALEKLSFELTYEEREPGDLDSQEFTFGPSITQVRGRWQRVWFISATHSSDEMPGGGRNVQTLLVPGISIASVPHGYLGETLFQRGFFAELRGSHGAFGSDSDFVQLRVQAERAFDLGSRWHIVVRGEVGASLVSQFSELPLSMRYFAGGDRSVRGFGFEELSPVRYEPALDEDGQPILDENGQPVETASRIGGKHLLTGSFELIRDLPRNMGAAVFFDFGNAFDRFGEAPDPRDPDFLEYSAGVGVRWRLPVVTVGIDVAQPLSEPGAGPRLHINFSPKL